MPVTRKDVAKKAGVSVATVNNVINNNIRVHEEKRKKVLEAINKLDYKTNMVARSLRTKETKQIALICSDFTNPYFSEIAQSIEEEASKYDYILSLITSLYKSDYVSRVISHRFDGLVYFGDITEADHINDEVAKSSIPIVIVGNEHSLALDERITQIFIDIYKGAYQLFEFIVKKGHRRIAYFSPGPISSLNDLNLRMRAYQDVLKVNDIELDPDLIPFDVENLDDAYRETIRLLEMKSRPTAIFSGNDNFAQAIIYAIREKGLDIPGDISIAGFDNLSRSKYYLPSLTTVEIPKNELGRKAVQILIKKIRKEPVDNILINTRLIERDSVSEPKK